MEWITRITFPQVDESFMFNRTAKTVLNDKTAPQSVGIMPLLRVYSR
jgi:hypothetical protein